jgi:hypothetical protein
MLKSQSRPASRRRPARARLGLETLEARDLMTVSAGIVNGQLLVTGAAFDSINVDHAQGSTIVSGTGLNATSFLDNQITNGILIKPGTFGIVNILGEGKSTTIDDLNGAHASVSVGKFGQLNDVLGSLNIVDTTGLTSLTVDDSADTTARNVTLGINTGQGEISGLGLPTIFYNNFGGTVTFNGGPGNGTVPNTYTVQDTVSLATTILNTDTGTGKTSTVNVQGTTGVLDVNGGKGNDTFNISSTAKTLDTIKAKVSVDGGGGTDTLNVNDQGSTTPHTYVLSGGEVSRDSAKIDFANVKNVHVNGGSGKNTIDVQQVLSTVQMNVFGAGGNNTFNVSSTGFTLDTIQGGLVLHGSGGTDTLNVNDQAAATSETYTIQATSVQRNGGPAPIVFDAGIKNVNVNGTNTGFTSGVFNVVDTPKNAVTTLNTGSGNSTVNVEGTTGALVITAQGGNQHVNIGLNNSVKSINGAVSLTNSNGETGLDILDAAGPAANVTMGVNAQGVGFINGLAPAPIDYAQNDVSQVDVNGPQGANKYTITDTAKSAKVSTGTLITAAINSTNTFNVQKTTGGLEIIDGSGKDIINVGSTANTLDTIQGVVTVQGSALGFDTLNINDQGSKTPHTYFQTAGLLARSGAADIFFSNIASLHVNKGPVLGSPPQAKDLKLTQPTPGSPLVTLTGQLTDSDPAAKLTLTVDWGDTSQPKTITPGQLPFKLEHTYAKKGTYIVRVVWTDLKTHESNSEDLKVTVA